MTLTKPQALSADKKRCLKARLQDSFAQDQIRWIDQRAGILEVRKSWPQELKTRRIYDKLK
jgi:hypothetical protein